jgi:hypothetical protein
MNRVRDYLLDNVGHMTFPGQPSFDASAKRWFVPICCRTERGAIVVGDVEVDVQGHVVFAPSREEMLSRLASASPKQLLQPTGAASSVSGGSTPAKAAPAAEH